jgi:cytochrome c553
VANDAERDMKHLTPLAVSMVLTWLGFARVQASEQADVQKPEAAAACVACHGPTGNQPVSPETPRLAGQDYDYLVHALGEYRDGARQNPIMGAMARSLSDPQIQALAHYFAAQPGLTVKY